MQITSMAALIEHSTIKKSKPAIDEHLTGRNQYYHLLLWELYRDVKFFYGLLKSGSAVADQRLLSAVKAFSETAKSSPLKIVEIFFTSIADDKECRQFLIDQLKGFEGNDDFMTQTLGRSK